MELKEKEEKDDKDKAFRNAGKLIWHSLKTKVPNNSGFDLVQVPK